jgi:hypothetical protein
MANRLLAKYPAALLAAAISVAGCGKVLYSLGPRPSAAVTNGATITLTPSFSLAGYRTQVAVEVNRADRVQHLALRLFRVIQGQEIVVLDPGGNQVVVDVQKSSLGSSVTMSGLAFDLAPTPDLLHFVKHEQDGIGA